MPKKVHVGLIGAGFIACDHAASLKLNRRCGQISVFDVDARRAAALAQDFDAIAAPSQQALIDSCDLVWICSPPAFHRAPVAAACRAGKAVFCEKPLAHQATDARAIARTVREAGVPFFMGHSGRWNRVFAKMRDMVRAGDIGEPTLVWSTRLGYLDAKTAPRWRLDDSVSGGAVVELGVHEIDFLRWVGGEFESVAAVGSSKALNAGKFQDSVAAVGRLAGGMAARLDLSWAEPRYLWQRGVRGTAGALLFDDSRFPEIAFDRPGSKTRIVRSVDWIHPKTKENMAFREQAEGVLKAFTAGEAPAVTIDDGLRAIEIAAAMRLSVTTGRAVKVRS